MITYWYFLLVLKENAINHPSDPISAQALTCFCIGQYCSQHPSNSNNRNYDNSIRDDEFEEYSSTSLNDSISSSCEAKKGAKCFSAVRQVEDTVTGELVPER